MLMSSLKPLLTIVVPAYNVERYIEECITSIYRQAPQDGSVQVLVVDDGSPDGSVAIVKRLQMQYPSLSLVSQENRGLGGARNTGVREAAGEYVWFVDSDDTLIGSWARQLIPILASGEYDAVATCASDITLDGMTVQRMNFNGLPTELSGVDFLATGRFSYCAPFTLYRRDFLLRERLEFKEHLYHEDMEFTPRAYYAARRIAVVDESFYLVRPNPDSITRSVNFRKNFHLLRIAAAHAEFANAKVDAPHKYIFSTIISLVLNNALANSASMPADTLRDFESAVAEQKQLLGHYLRSKKMKYLCQGLIFKLIPANPVWTYNNIQKLL